jgi:hypothetical protein
MFHETWFKSHAYIIQYKKIRDNQTLHEDLNIPYITEVIQERNNKHRDKIKIHIMAPIRATTQKKVKKSWPVDLIDGWRCLLTGEDLIMT